MYEVSRLKQIAYSAEKYLKHKKGRNQLSLLMSNSINGQLSTFEIQAQNTSRRLIAKREYVQSDDI